MKDKGRPFSIWVVCPEHGRLGCISLANLSWFRLDPSPQCAWCLNACEALVDWENEPVEWEDRGGKAFPKRKDLPSPEHPQPKPYTAHVVSDPPRPGEAPEEAEERRVREAEAEKQLRDLKAIVASDPSISVPTTYCSCPMETCPNRSPRENAGIREIIYNDQAPPGEDSLNLHEEVHTACTCGKWRSAAKGCDCIAPQPNGSPKMIVKVVARFDSKNCTLDGPVEIAADGAVRRVDPPIAEPTPEKPDPRRDGWADGDLMAKRDELRKHYESTLCLLSAWGDDLEDVEAELRRRAQANGSEG